VSFEEKYGYAENPLPSLRLLPSLAQFTFLPCVPLDHFSLPVTPITVPRRRYTMLPGSVLGYAPSSKESIKGTHKLEAD